MTFEDFKAVYQDATPPRLLRLLVDTLDHKGSVRVEYATTGNPEVKEWCSREVAAMDDQAEWIWGELMDFFSRHPEDDARKEGDRNDNGGNP